MSETVKFNEIEERIIVLRDIPILLDSDVAYLYGVETREINQAVKNNPRKFQKGFIIDDISKEENKCLKSKILTLNAGSGRGQHSKYLPKAFTEQGLYMLATVLKGERAEDTTIKIVQTFARMRELSRTIKQIAQEPEGKKRNSLLKKGGEIMSNILDNDLDITSIETSFEINLAAIKIKHTVKRGNK